MTKIPAAEAVVVIRTVGERTLVACMGLLASECADVRIVQAPPVGVMPRTDARWLVTIDADHLPRRGAVARLLELAERKDAVKVEGRTADNLLGVRRGGLTVFDMAAVSLDREDHRTVGYVASDEITTAHDHEQFLVDVFRKGLWYAHKHASQMREWLPQWQARGRAGDLDCRVACMGAAAAAQVLGVPDVRVYEPIARLALSRAGLHERAPLVMPGPSFEDVETLIGAI